MKDSCVAGIISYNPDLKRLVANVDAIYKQVSHVIIVDNGSDNYAAIKDCFSNYDNVILEAGNENKGIAWALNRCFSIANQYHVAWVLTLDQDSVCPDDMIASYAAYLDKISKKAPEDKINHIGILCPTIVDRNVGIIEGGNVRSMPIAKCITSGALTACIAWEAVGGFDEKMFIDGVDFEFCERLHQNNYYIIRVAGIELLHELGQMTTKKILGKELHIKNHPATRKYYITRNRLYVAHKHKQQFSITKAYLSIAKAFFVVLLFESEKKQKCKEIIKGAHDYKFM